MSEFLKTLAAKVATHAGLRFRTSRVSTTVASPSDPVDQRVLASSGGTTLPRISSPPEGLKAERQEIVDRFEKRNRMNPVVEALSLLTPYDIDKAKVRIGNKTDGGYILADCISNAQVVLSYGIGTEYSFDIELAKRGHDVYMFDHTVEGIQSKNKKLHFFSEGVAGSTNEADHLFSIQDHLDRHRLSGDRRILKMDVEGAEYEAFEALPEESLNCFEQIVFEVHLLHKLDEFAFRDRFCRIFRRLNSMFTLFHVHANNWDGQNGLSIVGGVPVSSLLELSYIKTPIVHRQPSQTLYPTNLDYPNVTQFQDKLLWFYPFLPTSITKESFVECAARVEHIHDLRTGPR